MSDSGGWKLLTNSRKWHWFRPNGMSLCGRWFTLSLVECEQGNDESPDNCATCRAKRLKASADRVNV